MGALNFNQPAQALVGKEVFAVDTSEGVICPGFIARMIISASENLIYLRNWAREPINKGFQSADVFDSWDAAFDHLVKHQTKRICSTKN